MRSRMLLILLMVVPAFCRAEDFPIPAATRLEVVAEELVQNGTPMFIQRFQSDMVLDEVREFYRAQWSEPVAPSAPGHVENSVGEWQVISRLTGHENWLVQMRPSDSGGTTGFLARISRVPQAQPSSLTDLLPASLAGQLLSMTESRVDGGMTVTAIYRIAGHGDDALARAQQHLTDKGLQVRQAFEQNAVRIRFLSGSRVSAELAVQRDGGDQVLVINLAEH